jgi:hypothetical protein
MELWPRCLKALKKRKRIDKGRKGERERDKKIIHNGSWLWACGFLFEPSKKSGKE